MRKKYAHYIIFFIFFICLCLASYFFIFKHYYQKGAVYSPDFFQVNYFSDRVIRSGRINVAEPLNKEIYPIFGARSMKISPEGELAPGIMIGQIFIFALFKIIWQNLTFIITPLFSLGCLILVYLISKKLFRRSDLALISVILVMFFAPFLNFSIIPYNNIISLFFSLLSVFYFFKIINPHDINKATSMALLSFFVGIVFIVRYPDALILLISFLAVFGIKLYKKEVKFERKFLYSIPMFLVPFVFFLVMNYVLSGKLLVFGNINTPTLLFAEEGRNKIFGLFYFDGFDVLLHNFLYFVISPLSPIVIAVLLLMFKKKAINRDYLVFCGVLLLFYSVLYLGTNWTGSEKSFFTLTSLSRYLLLFYILLIILVPKGLSFIDKKTLISLISIYIIINIFILVKTSYGLEDHIRSIKRFEESQNKLISAIPEGSIVFTAYNDKYIFPVRKTAIYSSIAKDKNLDTTTQTASELIKKGYQVYFINEDWYENKPFNFSAYEQQFSSMGLSLEPTTENSIYRITRKNTINSQGD